MGNKKHWSCGLTMAEVADQCHSILVGVIDHGDDISEAVDAIQVLDDAVPYTEPHKRLHAVTRPHCCEYDATYIVPTHDDLVKIVDAIDNWR